MRKTIFAPGEFYHLCGRGNEKQILFLDVRDYVRFLFLILYFQSPVIIYNIGRSVSYFIKYKKFNLASKTKNNILKKRSVELVSFSIMPNHFHLIVNELQEYGISQYMQRVLMAYAKYFNEKYKKSGHVFQGPFRAINIEDNEQLLYTSAYIHRNSREIKKWKDKEHLYPWSSYQDFLGENRWDEFLKTEIILEQCGGSEGCKKLVDDSGAKEYEVELLSSD